MTVRLHHKLTVMDILINRKRSSTANNQKLANTIHDLILSNDKKLKKVTSAESINLYEKKVVKDRFFQILDQNIDRPFSFYHSNN